MLGAGVRVSARCAAHFTATRPQDPDPDRPGHARAGRGGGCACSSPNPAPRPPALGQWPLPTRPANACSHPSSPAPGPEPWQHPGPVRGALRFGPSARGGCPVARGRHLAPPVVRRWPMSLRGQWLPHPCPLSSLSLPRSTHVAAANRVQRGGRTARVRVGGPAGRGRGPREGASRQRASSNGASQGARVPRPRPVPPCRPAKAGSPAPLPAARTPAETVHGAAPPPALPGTPQGLLDQACHGGSASFSGSQGGAAPQTGGLEALPVDPTPVQSGPPPGAPPRTWGGCQPQGKAWLREVTGARPHAPGRSRRAGGHGSPWRGKGRGKVLEPPSRRRWSKEGSQRHGLSRPHAHRGKAPGVSAAASAEKLGRLSHPHLSGGRGGVAQLPGRQTGRRQPPGEGRRTDADS